MNAAERIKDGPVAVRVIRTKRLYEQIADEIVRFMRENGLQVGSRLPSEVALAEQLGVSRPSVREAMIALETAGLIEVRTGDGTYVRRLPGQEFRMPWARADDPGPGPREQYAAQEILECEAVALTAEIISDEQIDHLEDIVDRMARRIERGQNPVEQHMEFHVALAQASGNGMIAGYVREIWEMRQEPMWDVLRAHALIPDSLRAGVASRRQLIACLRAHDVEGAKNIMRQHFSRMRKIYFAE